MKCIHSTRVHYTVSSEETPDLPLEHCSVRVCRPGTLVPLWLCLALCSLTNCPPITENTSQELSHETFVQ